MRKILIILTLIVSSFFICNSNVKADTFDFIIDDKDLSLLTDEFYSLREKAIEYSEQNEQYYIISYTTDGYRASFFDIGDYGYQYVSYSSVTYPRIQVTGVTVNIYKLESDSLVKESSTTKIQAVLRDTTYENLYSYANYLDTNIELLDNVTTSVDGFNIIYNDFTYTVNPTEHLPSLYEVYLLMNSSNPPEEDEVVERNESLDLFYSLVIEKIQLFANCIVNNNSLLFSVVILLLIFVVELIFRRLL